MRSAVGDWMLVVPPRRLFSALVLLSRVIAPPSARISVRKPTFAEAPESTTEPKLTCRVPRMLALLSPVSVQEPVPILVMFSCPVV